MFRTHARSPPDRLTDRLRALREHDVTNNLESMHGTVHMRCCAVECTVQSMRAVHVRQALRTAKRTSWRLHGTRQRRAASSASRLDS